jgi:hypothetical protein
VIPALQAAQGETVEEFVQDAANRLVSKLDDRLDFLKLMFIELVEFNGQLLPTQLDQAKAVFANCDLVASGLLEEWELLAMARSKLELLAAQQALDDLYDNT